MIDNAILQLTAKQIYAYLRPTASIGSKSSLMSCWILGPMARASILMQVKTVASTCTDFCLLEEDHKITRSCYISNIFPHPPSVLSILQKHF